ncbi:hypothetical protein OX283_003985 [Flavobacterium sp. SUN052]|uniref:hypothetical protein n=1 Tax=Flavobacterium sp. SUN052 TaxID=3002441 RepID=UPI00237D3B86|nr:hypothetical protein [Flavobacterium sp. SUN052]MEC4003804.1 hypothetical protein [Flavobacterium sp. SUN052]
MKTSKIALIVNLACCFLAIIGDIFKLDSLQLFTIPIIIPALAFYYYVETKKISILVCLYLLSNFIGDSIAIMNFDDELKYILLPFFMSNIIMIVIMIINLEKFKLNFINIIAISIVISFLGYMWKIVVELFNFSEGSLQIQVAVFGFSLLLLATLATYNIVWRINNSNLFLMVSSSCVLVSDVFYMIYNFQNQLVVLDSIHFACQMVSYFFFIKYILLKEERTIILK